jgi:hypothetical protein
MCEEEEEMKMGGEDICMVRVKVAVILLISRCNRAASMKGRSTTA